MMIQSIPTRLQLTDMRWGFDPAGRSDATIALLDTTVASGSALPAQGNITMCDAVAASCFLSVADAGNLADNIDATLQVVLLDVIVLDDPVGVSGVIAMADAATLSDHLIADDKDRAQMTDKIALAGSLMAPDHAALTADVAVVIRPAASDVSALIDTVTASLAVEILDAVSLADSLGLRTLATVGADQIIMDVSCAAVVSPATDGAGMIDLLITTCNGVATSPASLIDTLTGDLCASSVFGSALLGDALFG